MVLPKPSPQRNARYPKHPWERRADWRYELHPPITVEARWEERPRLLERASTVQNISAGGICFLLPEGDHPRLTVGTELGISFPLVERTFHPARVYAHCRARVVRREASRRVAARFEQVAFEREERPTGVPVPLRFEVEPAS